MSPCERVHCDPGEECRINEFGVASCQCRDVCEAVVRPVCASDGRTYDSECDLRLEACRAKKRINVAYFGLCG